MDLVTHDLRKFVKLMPTWNGYVLDQLHSPLVVRSSPLHAELKRLADGVVTRHHDHHYLGFAHTQWELFLKESPRRVKPLLYVYRVLLTGIHLMRTGRVASNLLVLDDEAKLPWIPDLVARKTRTREQATLDDADIAFHEREVARLQEQLAEAAARSTLPDAPTTRAELEQLLIEARLATLSR